MRPADDESPRLHHVFLPGLRFDTEMHFLARLPFGRTAWRRLPMLEASPEGSGWVALLQAETLVMGPVPSARKLRRASRPDLPALMPGDFLVRTPELAPRLRARWHPQQTLLASGEPLRHPALACLAGPKGMSWALVVGVELEHTQRPQSSTSRALLLLDPRLAGPWATGYNARLSLREERWRGLDGEVQSLGLLGLIELMPREPAGRIRI